MSRNLRTCYYTLPCKCYLPEIHQTEKLRFLDISWYKFTLGFGFGRAAA